MNRIATVNVLAVFLISSLASAAPSKKPPVGERGQPQGGTPAAATAPTVTESPAATKPTAAEPTAPATLDANSLADIDNATKAMSDCAAIADEIAAQKVPTNYVATRRRKATKEHPANKPDPDNEKHKAERAKRAAARAAEEDAIAKGPKNPNGASNAPAEPQANPVTTPTDADDTNETDQSSEAFIQKMDALNKRLDTCGQEYERAAKNCEKVMKSFAKSKLSKEDAATAGAAVGKYQAARQKLEASIDALSNDRQIQAYVHPVLKAHFLKL
ncbi:MAG: hypothetical protein ABI925_04185 [Verrucomicrobiota bacterium]